MRRLEIQLSAVGVHFRRFTLVDVATWLRLQHVELGLDRLPSLQEGGEINIRQNVSWGQ